MMNRQKTLDALRALADRPGTEAEGRLARELLDKFLAKEGKPASRSYPAGEESIWSAFEQQCRGDITVNDFIEELRRWENRRQEQPLPNAWVCSCGLLLPIGKKCDNLLRHAWIQTEIRTKFQKGDRVYYNRWAYPPNCPGTVAGYVKLKPSNGDHPWAWITVKFDHLKSNRQIPIVSAKGWHLSKVPLTIDELYAADLRGGMERNDGHRKPPDQLPELVAMRARPEMGNL